MNLAFCELFDNDRSFAQEKRFHKIVSKVRNMEKKDYSMKNNFLVTSTNYR